MSRVGALTVLLGLLVAGCGGGGETATSTVSGEASISKARFIEEADEVCTAFNAEYDEHELDEAGNLSEVETALENAMPPVEGSVEQLKELPLPSDDPAGAERYVEKAEEAARLLRQLQHAIRARDIQAYRTSAVAIKKLTAEEGEITSAYGFHVCGQTG